MGKNPFLINLPTNPINEEIKQGIKTGAKPPETKSKQKSSGKPATPPSYMVKPAKQSVVQQVNSNLQKAAQNKKLPTAEEVYKKRLGEESVGFLQNRGFRRIEQASPAHKVRTAIRMGATSPQQADSRNKLFSQLERGAESRAKSILKQNGLPKQNALKSPETSEPMFASFVPAFAGSRITNYNNNSHKGMDFAVNTGTVIQSPISGTVVRVNDWNYSYGKHVVVKDNDGNYHYFAHLSGLGNLKPGQRVEPGTVLGASGSTGNSTGPHLHYEVRRGDDYNQQIDPSLFLKKQAISKPVQTVMEPAADERYMQRIYKEYLEEQPQREKQLERQLNEELAETLRKAKEEEKGNPVGNFMGWLGKNTMAGLGSFNKGVAQTIDFFLPDFITPKFIQRGIESYKRNSDKLDEYAREANEKMGGKGWGTAGGIIKGVGGAIPNATLALMSGGISSGAQAVTNIVPETQSMWSAVGSSVSHLMKNPAFWTSFASTTGGTYEEAKQEGAGEFEAQATALISGFLNAGVEVGGGVEAFGKNGSGVKAWVRSMVDEGKEEVVQGVVENLAKKALYDSDKEYYSADNPNAVINPKRMGLEFAGGAVAGGVLGGAQRGIAGLANVGKSSRANQTSYNLPQNPNRLGNGEMNLPRRGTNALPEGAIRSGRATTIYHPYSGTVPTVETKNTNVIEVSGKALTAAQKNVERANSGKLPGDPRKILKTLYNQWFDSSGGKRNIAVNGLSFNGSPYKVEINKSVIGKVIADSRLSPEKLAVFDVIEDVVSNGDYVGSGIYTKPKKQGYTTRFDYFETPIKIGGQDYVVAFDVEVFPNVNNYRTHKIINKMDLIEADSANLGTVPSAPESSSSPTFNLPQQRGVVKGEAARGETAKSQAYQNRRENQFVSTVADILSVPKSVSREQLKPIAAELALEYKNNGAITSKAADGLFEKAYEQGRILNEEFYNQYKEAKEFIKGTTIKVPDNIGITDYNAFRKQNFGILRLSRQNGIEIDVAYDELNSLYPELFPSDITHPTDQLEKISEVVKSIRKVEVSLDEYYGDAAEAFKESAHYEFDKELQRFSSEMGKVLRFETEQTETPQSIQIFAANDIAKLYEKAKPLQRAAEKAVANNLLTEKDRVQVDRLLKGEIGLDELPKGVNTTGIKAVYEAKKAVRDLLAPAEQYKRQRRQRVRAQAENNIQNSDEWKDIPFGLWGSIKTMERNFKSSMGEDAARMTQTYLAPVHKSEAKRNRFKSQYRQKVKELNLSKAESEAVQFLGEVQSEIDSLRDSQKRKKLPQKKGDRLIQLIKLKNDYLQQHHKLDMGKVNNAIQTFRSIYDELFQQMNEVRVANGYNPVPYRKHYFPHFTDGVGDTILAKLAHGLGINMDVKDLPTDIAGLTHTFRPGKAWFGNEQQRKGNRTTYDAVSGFDKYIEGISDVIYHTENIQRLRALSDAIRYKYSDAGTQGEIDKVMDDGNLSFEQKQAQLNELKSRDITSMSTFVQELEEYTNLLANKKSKHDRETESLLGRGFYNVAKWANNRVVANMVALNPGSWLTNFVPLAQGGAEMRTTSFLNGMADTVKSYLTDDGFSDVSTFLTNRKGGDPLVKNMSDRVSGVLTKPMEWIDMFTAETLTRGKYYDNVKNGMSEIEALDAADSWAASVMADRSKGSMPTLFSSKNPGTKLFTMFQLEVNNQLWNLFADLPDRQLKKNVGALAGALVKFLVGSYLYNMLYEKVMGREAAFDPIGMIQDTVLDFGSGEVSKRQAVANLGENIAQEIPFVGGLLGGGRLPVSSALPNIPNLSSNITGAISGEVSGEKALNTIGKEVAKPAAYIFPPFGGGQIKKAVEGYNTIKKGGSYSMDNEGEEKLQYPADETPGNYAKAMIFGKTSLAGAKKWIDSGFKTLSAKDTEKYRKLVDEGQSPTKAYETIMQEKAEAKEKADKQKAFKERLNSEVGEFKYANDIEDLNEWYKENHGGDSANIGSGEKARTYTHNYYSSQQDYRGKYELTDDLLIERNKLYKEALEKAYAPILSGTGTEEEKVKRLQHAKKKAAEQADWEFWEKHKDEIVKGKK